MTQKPWVQFQPIPTPDPSSSGTQFDGQNWVQTEQFVQVIAVSAFLNRSATVKKFGVKIKKLLQAHYFLKIIRVPFYENLKIPLSIPKEAQSFVFKYNQRDVFWELFTWQFPVRCDYCGCKIFLKRGIFSLQLIQRLDCIIDLLRQFL